MRNNTACEYNTHSYYNGWCNDSGAVTAIVIATSSRFGVVLPEEILLPGWTIISTTPDNRIQGNTIQYRRCFCNLQMVSKLLYYCTTLDVDNKFKVVV